MTESNKEALRAFVRNSLPAQTPQQGVEQFGRIWSKARELSGQKIGAALWLALDATDSSRHKDESEEAYRQRVDNGLPATLFGAAAPLTGIDKLRHFFAAALTAFYLNRWLAELAGWLVELLGLLTKPFGGTGFDQGDIFADKCGAKFGQALKRDPKAAIETFITL